VQLISRLIFEVPPAVGNIYGITNFPLFLAATRQPPPTADLPQLRYGITGTMVI
jgi:hypothetical protein